MPKQVQLENEVHPIPLAALYFWESVVYSHMHDQLYMTL